VLAQAGYIGGGVLRAYQGGKYVVVPTSAALGGGGASLSASQRRIANVMGDSLPEIIALP